jgi:hypothetical protein
MENKELKIAEPVLNECEVSLLRNIPRVSVPRAEIAAVAVGSFAMTGPAFLSHTGSFRGWGLAMKTAFMAKRSVPINQNIP